MKKILILLIMAVGLLAGCGSTRTVGNLEYMDTVETEATKMLIFENESGDIVGFNIDRNDELFLTKGEKYNVEHSITSFFEYGEYIEDIELSYE